MPARIVRRSASIGRAVEPGRRELDEVRLGRCLVTCPQRGPGRPGRGLTFVHEQIPRLAPGGPGCGKIAGSEGNERDGHLQTGQHLRVGAVSDPPPHLVEIGIGRFAPERTDLGWTHPGWPRRSNASNSSAERVRDLGHGRSPVAGPERELAERSGRIRDPSSSPEPPGERQSVSCGCERGPWVPSGSANPRLLSARRTVLLKPCALRQFASGEDGADALRSGRPRSAREVPRVTSVSATIAGRSACSAASRTRSATSIARRLSSATKYARASCPPSAMPAGWCRQIGELLRRRLEERDGVATSAGVEEPPRPRGGRVRLRWAVPEGASRCDRSHEMGVGGLPAGCATRGLPGTLEKIGSLGRVGRDLEGLVQESQGLVVRAEADRSLGGRLEGDPRLATDGLGFAPSDEFRYAAR